MFQIDPSKMPSLRTRRALLCIDLQNDFLSPDGALPVTLPEGFVERTLQVVSAFRESGAGDIIWIRSEFAEDHPAEADQIVVSDILQMPQRPGQRGRTRVAPQLVDPPEADPEAFLSVAPEIPDNDRNSDSSSSEGEKPACVRSGTRGAELAPQIAAAVDPADSRLTKTDYSAFETGQLLQLLRGRFATELYICGALTNASVYATALAAGSHGYDITIIDDCCGYRSDMRHTNATRQLMHLTGCEVLTAEEVIQAWLPPKPPPPSKKRESRSSPRLGAGSGSGAGRKSPSRPSQANLPVRPKPAAEEVEGSKKKSSGSSSNAAGGEPPSASQAVDLSKKNVSLSAASSTAAPVKSRGPPNEEPRSETARHPIQPMVKSEGADSKDECIATDLKPVVGAGAQTRTRDIEALEAENDAPFDLDSQSAKGPMAGDDSPLSQTRVALKSTDRRNLSKEVDKPAETSKTRGESPLEESVLAGAAAVEEAKQQTLKGDSAVKEDKKSVPQPTEQDFPSRSHPSQEKASSETESKKPTKASSYSEPAEGELQERDTQQASEQTLSKHSNRDPKSKNMAKDTSFSSLTTPSNLRTGEPIVSEPFCEGDTTIIQNVLPASLEAGIFERLRSEVQWQTMSHQGGSVPRLVAVQGTLEPDGTQPVYRHPSDEAPPLLPFSPTVLAIKAEVERHLGHEVNHVLIQFYRDGNDYISEHSDKTLDIVPDSFIANVSLGAERTMVFRTKRADKDHLGRQIESSAPGASGATEVEGATGSPSTAIPETSISATSKAHGRPSKADDPLKRQVRRAALPHNSLCRMGLKTNARWLHAIRQDKRLARDKAPAELAFGGQRISLTFRRIGTFLCPAVAATTPGADVNFDVDAPLLIWGQGATGKTRDAAQPVVNGQTPEAVRMLQAFGRENNASSIDWEGTYGGGFNVLHLRGAARFFAGGDAIVDGRVRALLAELGVKHAKGSVAASGGGEGSDGREHRGEEVEDGVVGAADIPVRFVDDDASRATVTGGLAIMLYLDAKYFSKSRGVPEQRPAAELAKVYTRVQQALALEDKWRATRARAAMVSEAAGTGESRGTTQKQCPKFNILKALKRELALWDGYATKAPAEAGGEEVTAQGHCYIAGGEAPSIADFALWPVLHDMAIVCGEDDDGGTSTGGSAASPLLSAALEKSGLGSLVVWYDAFGKRESIRTVFGRGGH